jgi:hypothetical protein
LLAAIFYAWTAGTSYELSLTGGSNAYNALASAFLHLHLSVGRAPTELVNLSEPYNPTQNAPFQSGLHDIVLYHGSLYITWGPAPAIVLLVPLHLLGFMPTPGLVTAVFAVAGLGFSLATLRVVLRQIGDVPLWMCVLAALTLALASAMPFTLRRPDNYEEEIAGGYCFVMAGIWLAIALLADRRKVSLRRLALISLCFGLATGSRPTLAFTAVLLVPVYFALRAVRPRRGLLTALVLPLGICLVLLLAYNQARFGDPLENGVRYQLAGIDQRTARFDDLAYVPPGLWFYWLSPPRAGVLFPFLSLTRPPLPYPGRLPGLYALQTETIGLLPMTPIVAFLAALPWIWRRRSSALSGLTVPLLLLGGAGIACVLMLSYLFYSATERYAVDFATLLLLGALASWLVLATTARGWRRRLARIGGGLLAAWSCVAGLAISFVGYENLLAVTHPGAWTTLQDVVSPISTALAIGVGHPVLEEVAEPSPPLLPVGEGAHLTIVSPGTRSAVLLVRWTPAEKSGETIEYGGYSATVAIRGPGRARSIYRVGAGGEKIRIPLRLSAGLNRVTVEPLATENAPVPDSEQLLLVHGLSLAK